MFTGSSVETSVEVAVPPPPVSSCDVQKACFFYVGRRRGAVSHDGMRGEDEAGQCWDGSGPTGILDFVLSCSPLPYFAGVGPTLEGQGGGCDRSWRPPQAVPSRGWELGVEGSSQGMPRTGVLSSGLPACHCAVTDICQLTATRPLVRRWDWVSSDWNAGFGRVASSDSDSRPRPAAPPPAPHFLCGERAVRQEGSAGGDSVYSCAAGAPAACVYVTAAQAGGVCSPSGVCSGSVRSAAVFIRLVLLTFEGVRGGFPSGQELTVAEI